MSLSTWNDLFKHVVYAYYELPTWIVADVVIRERYISDRDLGPLVGMSPVKVRLYLHPLVRDGLVYCDQVVVQGESRKYLDSFWYIDYGAAMDSIKYKLHCIQKLLADKGKVAANQETRTCLNPSCATVFSTLEALQGFDPVANVFWCKVCGTELGPVQEAPELGEIVALQKAFNEQMKPIVTLVRKLEGETPPAKSRRAYRRVAAKNVRDAGDRGASVNAAAAARKGQLKKADGVRDDGVANDQYDVEIDLGEAKGGTGKTAASTAEGHDGQVGTVGTGAGWNDNDDEPKKIVLPPWLTSDMRIKAGDGSATADADESAQSVNQASASVGSAGAGAAQGNMEEMDEEARQEAYAEAYYAQLAAQAAAARAEEDKEAGDVAMKDSDASGKQDEGDAVKVKEEASGVTVKVNGVEVPLEEVTDDMLDEMTAEEYKDFHEKSGAGEEDDEAALYDSWAANMGDEDDEMGLDGWNMEDADEGDV